MALFPGLGRVRLLRMWGGIMDMTMDGSPIIDRTHVGALFQRRLVLWRVQGDPGLWLCFAHLLATGTPHETAPPTGSTGSARAG